VRGTISTTIDARDAVRFPAAFEPIEDEGLAVFRLDGAWPRCFFDRDGPSRSRPRSPWWPRLDRADDADDLRSLAPGSGIKTAAEARALLRAADPDAVWRPTPYRGPGSRRRLLVRWSRRAFY